MMETFQTEIPWNWSSSRGQVCVRLWITRQRRLLTVTELNTAFLTIMLVKRFILCYIISQPFCDEICSSPSGHFMINGSSICPIYYIITIHKEAFMYKHRCVESNKRLHTTKTLWEGGKKAKYLQTVETMLMSLAFADPGQTQSQDSQSSQSLKSSLCSDPVPVFIRTQASRRIHLWPHLVISCFMTNSCCCGSASSHDSPIRDAAKTFLKPPTTLLVQCPVGKPSSEQSLGKAWSSQWNQMVSYPVLGLTFVLLFPLPGQMQQM